LNNIKKRKNMEPDEIIKEYGIEFAIEKVAKQINKKINEYKDNKDKEVQNELTKLLEDRDKIYSNDIETIRKYLIKK